jgi:hypothetical protein
MARNDDCTVVVLSVKDMDRAAGDAKLNALISAGWLPLTAVTIADAPNGPETHLMLRPPVGMGSTGWLRLAVFAGGAAGAVAGVIVGAVIWALSVLT